MNIIFAIGLFFLLCLLYGTAYGIGQLGHLSKANGEDIVLAIRELTATFNSHATILQGIREQIDEIGKKYCAEERAKLNEYLNRFDENLKK